jgi:small subunit ribosomal protein S2
MRGEPGVVVVIDLKREVNAAVEARIAGVPIVSLVDTNADPSLADFVVPGNDDALKSVRLMVSRLADAVLEGNAEREKMATAMKDSKPATPAKNEEALVAAGAESDAE